MFGGIKAHRSIILEPKIEDFAGFSVVPIDWQNANIFGKFVCKTACTLGMWYRC